MKEAKQRLILTGGGSAGHVYPNLALLPILLQNKWSVFYLGREEGMERDLVSRLHLPYYGLPSGKLRRYFSWKNFSDPLRVFWGLFVAYKYMGQIQPQVVFSKGGFVTVPVVVAAWLRRIPVVLHESDISPGLANKLSLPFAKRVCTGFPETVKHLGQSKAVYTGIPVREELHSGNAEKGIQFCGLETEKPLLLVMGGSLGSKNLNAIIRDALPLILDSFNVVHLCGKNGLDATLTKTATYRQYEYLHEELADLLAASDIIVSRAGATALFEFLELRKPMLLIPLSRKASRGDQIDNARSFEKQGFCKVLEEENCDRESLWMLIQQVWTERKDIIAQMRAEGRSSACEKVYAQICSLKKP